MTRTIRPSKLAFIMIFMEISRSIRKQTKEELEKKDARIEYLEVSLIVGLLLAPIDTLLHNLLHILTLFVYECTFSTTKKCNN